MEILKEIEGFKETFLLDWREKKEVQKNESMGMNPTLRQKKQKQKSP